MSTRADLAQDLKTLSWRLDDGSLTEDEAQDAVTTVSDAVRVLEAPESGLVNVLKGTIRALAHDLAKADPAALRADLEQLREWLEKFPEHRAAYAEAAALLEDALDDVVG